MVLAMNMPASAIQKPCIILAILKIILFTVLFPSTLKHFWKGNWNANDPFRALWNGN